MVNNNIMTDKMISLSGVNTYCRKFGIFVEDSCLGTMLEIRTKTQGVNKSSQWVPCAMQGSLINSWPWAIWRPNAVNDL